MAIQSVNYILFAISNIKCEPILSKITFGNPVLELQKKVQNLDSFRVILEQTTSVVVLWHTGTGRSKRNICGCYRQEFLDNVINTTKPDVPIHIPHNSYVPRVSHNSNNSESYDCNIWRSENHSYTILSQALSRDDFCQSQSNGTWA